MVSNNTKTAGNSKRQLSHINQRTLESILDEYKIISLKLFEYSDQVQETDEQWEDVAIAQAQLLDAQQALLIEAQSIKIKTNKDIQTLLKLWKADNIYGSKVTPSQGIILHLQEYFEKNATCTLCR